MALDGADDNFLPGLTIQFSLRMSMNDHSDSFQCPDDTHQITIYLPCRLAERINRYATDNASTITNVVIEALDQFLRERKEHG